VRHRLLTTSGARRIFAVTLEAGEEAVARLTALAAELRLGTSQFTGIGGFQRVSLGYFDPGTSTFGRNEIDEQVELLSLVGNVAEGEDGKPKLHAHVVLGRFDATTRGGHLVEAVVRPTLEVIIEETPAHVQRKHDAKTGLILLKP
jgi:predicted DNA-binding protein with PD1-like motif